MSSDELLKDAQESYTMMKQELGFKTSFEELDSIFFISDSVLSSGFVSKSFSRQVCSRIVETYMGWNNYLHNLAMPAPHYMIQMQEHKMMNDVDKKEIWKLIGETIAFVSKNALIWLNKDKKAEAAFINETVALWKTSFKPRLERLVGKVVEGWQT